MMYFAVKTATVNIMGLFWTELVYRTQFVPVILNCPLQTRLKTFIFHVIQILRFINYSSQYISSLKHTVLYLTNDFDSFFTVSKLNCCTYKRLHLYIYIYTHCSTQWHILWLWLSLLLMYSPHVSLLMTPLPSFSTTFIFRHL